MAIITRCVALLINMRAGLAEGLKGKEHFCVTWVLGARSLLIGFAVGVYEG